MSALEGLSIRIVGDHTESHYAGWLLAGLGASVEVVGTRPAVELSPTSQWLTSHASYRQAPAGAIAPHTVGADALIVDSGERLPEGRADELRAIRADAPALVLTSISPYGLSGPMAGRRATHQEAQAVAGLINETGFVDGPPVPVYGDIVRMATGANATLATLLGLWRRRRTRGGALVDLSVLETTVGLRSSWAYTYAYTGLVTRRSLVENIGHYLPCKDGYVHIYPATTSLDDLIRFLEIDESSIPAEVFPLDKSRQFSHPALLAIVRHAMSGITVDELVERGILWRIPVSPALTSDALVHDRHLEARGYFETARMGGAELRTPRYPFQGGIWRHEEPVDPGAARPAAPGSTGLPLEGIRVAEFGTAWSGPMCAEILALYGAEVIKVEAPERLDSGRANHYLDLIVRDPGYEFVYNSHPVNGGKLHFGLDINGPSGRATARRLTECLDILVTNISMRALTNLGMNGPAVQAVNPRCTVVHSTSAGLDGPYASLAGYGSGMELMTGLAAATAGAAGQPGMIRSQLLHPDIFGALHQATAAVAGLFRRERTGVGAIVDLSQFECGAVAGTRDLLRAQGAEEPQTAVAMRLPCAGDDQWLAVTASSDTDWSAISAVLGLPDLAATRAVMGDNGDRRLRRLEAVSPRWNKHELADALQAAGVAAEAVNQPDETLLNPHLRARKYFMRPHNEMFGARYTIGRWHHFDDTDVAPLDGVHWFGQDNERVLTQSLGYSPEEARLLQSDGTVRLGPNPGPQPARMTPVDAMLALRWIYRRDDDYPERLGIPRFEQTFMPPRQEQRAP